MLVVRNLWTLALLVALSLLSGLSWAHPLLDMRVSSRDQLLLERPRIQGLTRDIIMASVDRLKAVQAFPEDLQVVVIGTPTLAQVLSKHVVVVSTDVALLSEEQRLFVLAHEAHHATQGDREAVREFINERAPSFLTASELQERLLELQPEVEALRHRQELQADAAAAKAFKRLKLDYRKTAASLLNRQGASLTHPSDQQRLSHLMH